MIDGPGSPLREGDVVAGKYAVERVLGKGGMGVVVAARHLQLKQRVAIKFLLPAAVTAPDTIPRFLREAQAAGRIQSEHVVRVLDVATLDDGTPYMVMEFLEGRDLAQLLAARGPLPLDEAVGYMLQACEGVAEAHAAGIVHRDLKPANLFVCERGGGRSVVKVLDFGISKSADSSVTSSDAALTKTSAVMGSPLYMSPEQMSSAKYVDARTDVWSLGVALFELVCGRTPFEGQSMTELIAAVLQREPLDLRTLRTETPDGFAKALSRSLQKDRERRYPHVAAFAAAIAPFGPRHSEARVERISDVLGRTHGSDPARTDAPVAPRDVAFQTTTDSHAAAAASAGTGRPVSSERPAVSHGSRRWSIGITLGVVAVVGSVAVAAFVERRHPPPAVASSPEAPSTRAVDPATAVATAPAAVEAPVAASVTVDVAPKPAASPPSAPEASHRAVGGPPVVKHAPSASSSAPAGSAAPPPAAAPTCTVVQYFDAEGEVRFRKDCR